MQSHYEITVIKDGRFLFSTSERSALNTQKAADLTVLFDARFPATEGYRVNVTYWAVVGKQVGNGG